MEINRTELLDAIETVKGAVPSKDLTTGLSYVCFDKNKILSYNGNTAIVKKFKTGIKTLVSYEHIVSVLTSIQNESVDVFIENDILFVKTKKLEVKLNCVPSDSYVLNFLDEKFKEYDSYDKDFIDIINISSQFAGDSSGNDSNTYVNISGDGYCYSTDGLRVFRHKVSKKRKSILLSKLFCREIVKIGKPCILYKNKKMIKADYGDVVIYNLLSDVNPPDCVGIYSSISKKSNKKLLEIDSSFKDIVNRASAMSIGLDDKICNITINRKGIIILLENQLVGEIKESYSVKNKVYDNESLFVDIDLLISSFINITEVEFLDDIIHFKNDKYNILIATVSHV